MDQFAKFVGARMLLLIPIAILLAFIIVANDQLTRALLVGALVLLEVVRDALSIGALSPTKIKTRRRKG